MTDKSMTDITELLIAWDQGDEDALARLIPLVYEELHQLAKCHLRQEWRHDLMGTTSLVHEAYRPLTRQRVKWRDRHHFFGIVSRIMRRLIVDQARRRLCGKRHGREVPVDEAPQIPIDRAPELVAVDEALSELEIVDPELAEVVELRFFGGLTTSEISELLGVPYSQVRRRWNLAKERLHRRLRSEGAIS